MYTCTLPSFAGTHRTIKKKKERKRWCTPRADGPGGSAPVASFLLVIVVLLHFLPYPPGTLNVYSPREPLASYTKPFQPYIRNSFYYFYYYFYFCREKSQNLFFLFLSISLLSLVPRDTCTREEKRSFDKGRFLSSSPRCQAARRRDTTCIERLVWPSTKSNTLLPFSSLLLFLFIFLFFIFLSSFKILRPKRIAHAIGRINEGEKKEIISKE